MSAEQELNALRRMRMHHAMTFAMRLIDSYGFKDAEVSVLLRCLNFAVEEFNAGRTENDIKAVVGVWVDELYGELKQ